MHVLLHLLSSRCECVRECVCVCHHLNAGDINIDPRQPLKLASKSANPTHTPEGSATAFPLIFPSHSSFSYFSTYLFRPRWVLFRLPLCPAPLPCSKTPLPPSLCFLAPACCSYLLSEQLSSAGGLILEVISCIFALCHLCQLTVSSLSHTSHTAFLIHLHPAAMRRASAAWERAFWREVCSLVRLQHARIPASPYS